MTRYAYPNAAMIGDYARAVAGLLPVTAILAMGPVGPVAAGLLAALAALFAGFGFRTVMRHATRIEATEAGLVASGPLAAAIRWDQLDRISLAYYSTRRDRRDGWMQLELRAGGSKIRLDSRIDGFNDLVERSAYAASVRGLELNPSTAANLEALKIGNRGFSRFADVAGGRT
jgi:hypothetical protein